MKRLIGLALLTGCTYSFPEGWCNGYFLDQESASRYYYKTRAICQQTPVYFTDCMKDHGFQPCK